MKCGDCINYGTCRHTCNVVRTSDICSSFLGKLSCDGCKYDSDRFSDICYHDCIMFSDYEKEHFSIPKEKPMNKERYKNYIAISGGDMSPVTDYVNELEQRISILTDSNVARDLVIEKLKQQKAELIKVLRDVLGYAGQEEFIEACVKADAVLNNIA